MRGRVPALIGAFVTLSGAYMIAGFVFLDGSEIFEMEYESELWDELGATPCEETEKQLSMNQIKNK